MTAYSAGSPIASARILGRTEMNMESWTARPRQQSMPGKPRGYAQKIIENKLRIKLQLRQRVIHTLFFHSQLIMRTLLNDTPAIDHIDLVCIANSRQTMCNN